MYTDDINPKSYYGCALELPDEDTRLPSYQIQRKENGFDDTETWSLHITLFRFLAPRLKRLIECQENAICAHWPSYFDDFDSLLEAVEALAKDDFESYKDEKKYWEVVETLLPKLLPYMWW